MSQAAAPSPTARISLLTRRRFVKLAIGSALGGILAGGLAPVYASRIEPAWLQVTQLAVPLPRLPAAFDGLRIAQLSDFHLGPHTSAEDVQRAVSTANALQPDLIALTGDFVFQSANYSRECARELGRLRAPLGVYAVLGNHDVWTNADLILESLTQNGIRVLWNETHALRAAGERLWLIGLEDAGYSGFLGSSFAEFKLSWSETAADLERIVQGLPAAEPKVLLVHNPDFTEMIPEGEVDLALCGHTHGGQVRLPLIGAPVLPSCFGQKYASGLVRGLRTLVYVNRGVGMISPPVRLNCRPEVTLLTLQAA